MNTEKALLEISNDIDWDNWQNKNNNNEPWKVTQVLYCKLGWILDEVDLTDEAQESLEQVRNLIDAMSQDNYENN